MAKGLSVFQKLYGQLNRAQKEAVDAIEGPVMVVAGPGTGKTQVLTLRIANILRKTDTESESILALTFTEAGAISMRRRLVEIIGSEAYGVSIHTFHGFCNDIIKKYPEFFPEIIGAQHITDVDQAKIIERVIRDGKFKSLKPFYNVFYYLKTIAQNIKKLKQEGISPSIFTKIIKEEEKEFLSKSDLYHEKGPHAGKMKGEHIKYLSEIKKNKELARIYASYQKILLDERFYDWEDMIVRTKEAIEKNEELRRMLQEQYHYILVDEHQDTNTAQNKITELLAEFHQNPNIFVVGDEKQAIFRFQGASLENFLYFKRLYQSAKLIVLEENYRSTQEILDAAHILLPGKKKLKAKISLKKEKIKIRVFETNEDEHAFIARDIFSRIRGGTPPEEISVLYRDNGDAFKIAGMLEKHGIPFVIESEMNILEDAEIRKLILLLKAIDNFGSDEELINALHVDFLEIEPLDVFKIISGARARRKSAYDAIRDESFLKAVGVENATPILSFSRQLSKWRTVSKNEEMQKLFEIVIEESGFLSNLLSLADSAERLEALSSLFDEIKKISEAHRGARLGDFFSYLKTIEAHGMFLGASPFRYGISKVRLMTAHKSKGLEFQVVYITGVYDGHWGNRKHPERLRVSPRAFSIFGNKNIVEDEQEDERRLFYVAMTRTKRVLTITYAKIGENGKERVPSRFLAEIRGGMIDWKEIGGFRQKPECATKRFSPGKRSGVDIKNKEFVRELFDKRGLSVTGLNNYFECPWKYFYLTLLRIPKKEETYLMYGTAAHSALRDFFEETKKREVGARFMVDSFTLHLGRQAMEKKEYSRFLERGKSAFSGYFKKYRETWNTNVLLEFNIQGVFLGDIRLTGKLDKVEFVNGNNVNVVDYKTGKPKSRSDIEGITKNSRGNIKRQLVFYKILLDLYKGGKKLKMISGEIDFVEPNERGRYKKEKFEILPEETRDLSLLIKKTAGEIRSLSFWNSYCGDKKCEYCALRKMMK